jgi:hypothetical protein
MEDSSARRNKGPYFQGILADGERIPLTKEFVATFAGEFVNEVVEAGEQRKESFLFVPPGAPKTLEEHHLIMDGYPSLRYLQGSEWTCLFHSFASALHFLGLDKAGSVVAAEAWKYAADAKLGTENWKALLALVQTHCGWLKPTKISAKKHKILKDISIYPVVVSLEADDGGTQHAVTIVGKLIFDANCVKALPLCQEALDHCCSTDTKKSRFKRIYHGYQFKEDDRKKTKELIQMNLNNEYLHLLGMLAMDKH